MRSTKWSAGARRRGHNRGGDPGRRRHAGNDLLSVHERTGEVERGGRHRGGPPRGVQGRRRPGRPRRDPIPGRRTPPRHVDGDRRAGGGRADAPAAGRRPPGAGGGVGGGERWSGHRRQRAGGVSTRSRAAARDPPAGRRRMAATGMATTVSWGGPTTRPRRVRAPGPSGTPCGGRRGVRGRAPRPVRVVGVPPAVTGGRLPGPDVAAAGRWLPRTRGVLPGPVPSRVPLPGVRSSGAPRPTRRGHRVRPPGLRRARR